MSDGTVTLNEIINTALNSDNVGVPIDWKALCFKTYNVATNHIASLEAELETAKNALEGVVNTEPTGDAESTLTGRTHIT
jgi:hypothetical protein